MENLWAPWRMKYIESGELEQDECIFCSKLSDNADDKENLILHRGDESIIIMNLYPYSNGHLMIAPKRHIGDINELAQKELTQMMRLTQSSTKALEDVMQPQGFNIGFNLGRVAGAGVVDHLHLHIVPRWNGDTNFMPVISNTKVINEKLEETYTKLMKSLEKYL